MQKIQSTRDYRLFEYINSGENRPLDVKKHKRLVTSMKKYGFLSCFPIVVVHAKNGKLTIKDGQHRFVIAQSLALPIYYVEEPTDFDLAEINGTPLPWQLVDFARKHAANGIKPYEEGLQFAENHKLPISDAFALLAGTSSYSNIREQFVAGAFKVKDRAWAESVASLYKSLVGMSKQVKSTRMLAACLAVCRVPEFDARRLLRSAKRCHDKLASYSTKDSYLRMLEDIYNFGSTRAFGLAAAANNAERERHPGKHKNGNHDSAD